MAGKKKYFDLRYLFMRGLISRERWQRTRQYLKSAAECTSRAIVSLELSDQPIKSIAQAKQLEGIGGETAQRLKEILEKKDKSTERPADGKFVSSAAALLVALLDLTEQVEKSGTGEQALIPEDVLKCEAKPLCQEAFVEEENGFCQAWWRIEVLIKRSFVKRRKLNKAGVYELTIIGRDIAHRLQGERNSQLPKEKVKKMNSDSKPQVPTASTSTAHGDDLDKGDNYLYTNDRGKDGIILEVDTQEMGGDRVGLGDHCRRLERCSVCYRTCRLGCGDYRWVWRCDGVERTIPLLVERKRADDVANSLKDGRFWKQVSKMVDWKAEFEKKDIIARLVYVLEGDPADYVVRCADKCQGVGKCGNPTLTQVKLALKDLEEHPQIEIRRTNCVESTIQYLSVVTEEIGKRANKGEYDMLIVSEMVELSKPKEKTLENIPTKEQEFKPANTSNSDLDSKDDIIKIEDSQENINTGLEDFSLDMEDSRELPPLNQNSCKAQSSQANSTCSGTCKGTDSNKSKAPKEEVFDIDDELAIFSTFSEHSSLKRTCSDTDPDIKRQLSSPVKKIKFTSSADLVESGSNQVQSSPSHGKIYRMKQKGSPKKRNLLQSFESKGEIVSPVRFGESSSSVSVSPRGEFKSQTTNTESDCIMDEDVSPLRVKFPFTSKSASKDEKNQLQTSAQIHSVSSFGKSETLESRLITINHCELNNNDDASLESKLKTNDHRDLDNNDDDYHVNVTNNGKTKERSVSTLKQPIDSDSDSLPDVGFHIGTTESTDAIPSTSTNSNEREPSVESVPVHIPPTKTSPRRGKTCKKRSRITALHDDDDDVEMIEDDLDYVPETNRSVRRRNRSKMNEQNEPSVTEDLVQQVLDILPHCSATQVQTALRRSKLNVEQAVADLLDTAPTEDVVDLT